MMLMTVIGAGVAGAQDIDVGNTRSIGPKFHGSMEKRHELRDKIENLSAEVKAKLKAAKEAGDFEKVKSILKANGIEMPKLEKRMEKRFERREKRMGKHLDRKEKRMEHRADFAKLPESVRAELRAAFEAKDMEEVKSILKANGIGPKHHHQDNDQETADDNK